MALVCPNPKNQPRTLLLDLRRNPRSTWTLISAHVECATDIPEFDKRFAHVQPPTYRNTRRHHRDAHQWIRGRKGIGCAARSRAGNNFTPTTT